MFLIVTSPSLPAKSQGLRRVTSTRPMAYLPFAELRDSRGLIDASRVGTNDEDGLATSPRSSGAPPRFPLPLATIDFTVGVRARPRPRGVVVSDAPDGLVMHPWGEALAPDLDHIPWVPPANPHAGPRHRRVLPRARVLRARDAVVCAVAGDEVGNPSPLCVQRAPSKS